MVRELITVEGVDRSFGPVDVLKDINMIVNDGDRIGIVGHNGAGKTTLLNTISEQKQDVGDIDFAPGIRLAYLTQIRDIESDSTIEEELGRKGRQFQELEEEIAAIKAVKVMGLGVAGVDMLQSERGPLILEVNSSPGLEGIETATGKDIAKSIVRYIEKNI